MGVIRLKSGKCNYISGGAAADDDHNSDCNDYETENMVEKYKGGSEDFMTNLPSPLLSSLLSPSH